MTEPISASGQGAQVEAALRRASNATGVDFSLLVETARRESSFNPNARAGTSSATGLFQFIDSTWLDMVRRHGADHGLGAQAAQISVQGGRSVVNDPQARAQILALRNDPELSALMAGELTRENASFLQSRLGRAPQAGELYAAHVMGPGGAVRLIQAAESGAPSAAAVFPREAAANRGLFYRNGEPLSASALLDRFGVDAQANITTPNAVAATPDTDAPLSPALAHALFVSALLPLLTMEREDDARENGMAAYLRAAGST